MTDLADKALDAYYRFRGGEKPRKRSKEYNRQHACMATILEAIEPEMMERALQRLVDEAKGKIVPFRKAG